MHLLDERQYNLLVFAGRDSRKRYKFITEPAASTRRIHTHSIIVTQLIFYTIYRLAKYRMNRKPDMIISVGGGFVGFTGRVFSKLCGCPFAVRLGGDPVSALKQEVEKQKQQGDHQQFIRFKIIQILNAFTFRFTTHIFVPSSYLEKQLLNYPIFKDKQFFILPQFIASHTKKISPRKDKLSGKKEVKILTVTNLNFIEKYHGVKLLIDYLHQYSIKYRQHVRYTICGGGDYLDPLIRFKKEINAEYLKIDIKGYRTDIHGYYRSHDIFLYCSNFDALPNVILEAWSFGMPVMVNRNDIFEGILKNGETGCFFDEDDAPDFCENLRKVIEDDDFRRAISKNGFFDFKAKYSKAEIGQKLEQGITKAINFR